MKQKDSAETAPRKVMLPNSLNFSSNYNVITKQFSPVNVTGGTALFNGKLGVNFGAILNPYAIDNNGRQTEKWNTNNGGSLFRLTNANISTNYSFSNKDKKDKKDKNGKDKKSTGNVSGGRTDDLFGSSKSLNDVQHIGDKKEEKDGDEKQKFYQATILWDLTLAYSLTYSNQARESMISNNSPMFSGNVSLTPKWQVGLSSGYDFVNKGFTYIQLCFERDLNSFKMSFQFTPFGYRTSWYFFIGIKAPMLSDLKREKNKEPDRILR